MSYVCTVAGGIFTLWAGTAFMCGGNEISLRHDQFEGTIGECNNGAITANGIQSVDDCYYTSRLDVTLSPGLGGRTVTCSGGDGTKIVLLGTIMLTISTGNNLYNRILSLHCCQTSYALMYILYN